MKTKSKKIIPLIVIFIALAGVVIFAQKSGLVEYLQFRSTLMPNESIYEDNSLKYIAEQKYGDYLGLIEFQYYIENSEIPITLWLSTYSTVVLREIDIYNQKQVAKVADSLLAAHYRSKGESKPRKSEYLYTYSLTYSDALQNMDTDKFLVT